MQKFVFVLFCLLLTTMVNAQKITGTVKDESGKGRKGVTVSLLRPKDSTAIKFAPTKDDGSYEFSNVAPGDYLVSTSHVGYAPKISSLLTVSGADISVPVMNLEKSSANLAAVTVTSKKPIVEVKADKMIVNVEGTTNAIGNDALELLRKSPGVMVDKDDNLSLSGKNGVQVYIDGKPSPLTGQDLSNYLKSLQSSQIESFEIISNPSAKYEAAGNAGIINIRLKKNKSYGTNGSVNGGYNIGTYAKYNGGISFNNRNKYTNIFGNYTYNQGINVSTFNLYRTQADSTFDQINKMKSRNKGHNFKVGADYFINAKSTIGFVVNGNISDNNLASNGPTNIGVENTGEEVKVLQASSNNKMKRSNVNFNGNYRYAKQGGSELNVDLDYGFFNLRSDQFQPNNYFSLPSNTYLYSNVYQMIAPTDIDISSLKVDYEQNFKKGRLGYGGKIGYVKTDNDFGRYNVLGLTPESPKVLDTGLSNRFVYKENINAAYVNYNRAFKGLMVQAGLRIENTDSKGTSTGVQWNPVTQKYDDNFDSSIHRNYTDFFPSAAVTFNKNPKSMFNLTYSRRIDRPAYQDLNPFEFKLNDYTYQKGNTQLRPQYTNSFGITHTYMYKLNTTLNYSHVKDIFAQLPDTTQSSKAFMTKKNLATQDIVSLNISYPFSYKWYSFFANVNSYYSKYKADFGGGDRKINQDVYAVSFYMQNSFKLGGGFTGEISGFYNSPTLWQGIFKSISMYSVDGGLSKTLLKGKATMKATVSDIFHTLKWSGETNFTGTYGKASGRWESRQFKINFSYRFGNSQVKAARQRKSGAEDENKRTQSSGNGPGGQ